MGQTLSEKYRHFRNMHTWYNRLIDIFWYDIPRFISNIWWFRKELYKFYSFDSAYNIMLFRRSLEKTLKCLETDDEAYVSLNKKCIKIRRAIELLDFFVEDKDVEYAEKEFGRKMTGYPELKNRTEEEHAIDAKIFNRAMELNEIYWRELWQIIQGQDYEKYYAERPKEIAEDFDKAQDDYEKFYDGSGLNSWWF